MVKPLEALKAYFYEHAYPTWQQFHDVLDSFRHKSDKLPITDVDGLADQLNGKASSTEVNSGRIASANIDGNGYLILTLNDSTQLDAGLARGNSGNNGSDGTSVPVNLAIFQRGDSDPDPVKFKWIHDITVTSVQLMDCSSISVTIGSDTYNETTLVGVTLPAGTQLVINGLTVVEGETNAQAIIIF